MVGGFHPDRGMFLASTETYRRADGYWKIVEEAALPSPAEGIRGVSFNNQIFMSGEQNASVIDSCESKELQLTRIRLCFAGGFYRDDLGNKQDSDLVLRYDVTESKWKPVGKMKSKRYLHGFSVIPAKDAAEYCNK